MTGAVFPILNLALICSRPCWRRARTGAFRVQVGVVRTSNPRFTILSETEVENHLTAISERD